MIRGLYVACVCRRKSNISVMGSGDKLMAALNVICAGKKKSEAESALPDTGNDWIQARALQRCNDLTVSDSSWWQVKGHLIKLSIECGDLT